jgi:hypothetical protein
MIIPRKPFLPPPNRSLIMERRSPQDINRLYSKLDTATTAIIQYPD